MKRSLFANLVFITIAILPAITQGLARDIVHATVGAVDENQDIDHRPETKKDRRHRWRIGVPKREELEHPPEPKRDSRHIWEILVSKRDEGTSLVKRGAGSWDPVEPSDVFDVKRRSTPLNDGGSDSQGKDLERGYDDGLSHIAARQSSPTPLETYQGIASVIFAIQVLGALHKTSERDYLCNQFKMNNVDSLGFNSSKLEQVICAATPDTAIPLPGETVKNSLQLYSGMLWLQTTMNAFFGNNTALCQMFNVDQAEKVGLDGDAVRTTLCNAAGGKPPAASSDGKGIVPAPDTVISSQDDEAQVRLQSDN